MERSREHSQDVFLCFIDYKQEISIGQTTRKGYRNGMYRKINNLSYTDDTTNRPIADIQNLIVKVKISSEEAG